MEQGWTGVGGDNGPSGQNVVRPEGNGPHPNGGYDAASASPVSVWAKVDDKAGEIGPDGVGHGHFSQNATGQSNSAGPWKQT